jgi:hypothetical protein
MVYNSRASPGRWQDNDGFWKIIELRRLEMWLMKHVINPLVRLILISPVHRMMSAGLLLFIYKGKKSGKEYQLPVQYAQDGDVIYVVPGEPGQKTWWRNLRGGARVQLILRGQALSGQADLLEGELDESVIAEALGIYFRRFPAAGRMNEVRVGRDGACEPDDLQRAARSIMLVRVKLDRGN